MKIFGQLSEVVKVVFRLSGGKEVKLEAGAQGGTSIDRTFQLPPVTTNSVYTGELVEKDLAQILTQKTISGDSNTLQDVAITSLKTVLGDANKALVRDATGAVTSAKIGNDNVSTTAGIVYSKLNLNNSITKDDIVAAAGIEDTKLATISTAGKVSGSAITSGTIGGSTAVNTSGTVTAASLVGPLTGSAISGATSVSYAVTTANADSTVTPAADRPIILLNNLVSGTINSVANPAAGKQVFLINDGLADLTINDNNGGTSGILTGTGAAFTLKTNASVSLLYNSSQSRWVLSGGAGGGGGGTVIAVNQSHTFVEGEALYLNGTTYAKAIASAANTAEVVGIVSKNVDATHFELTLVGEVSKAGWGLTPGEVYFLSPSTAGGVTATEPTTLGQVSLPLGVAVNSTTMIVAPKRGAVVGGTNARTQLNLLNVTTPQEIQNASAYDAGELTGWVSISATTPKRFYIAAQWAKNGAGSDYNISYQTSGDTPPTGFNVTISSGGIIYFTLASSSIAGFSSAVVNYALNAPAVGATFPLAIDADRISTGTIAAARLPQVSTSGQGAFPSLTSSLDNATATQLGLKQYLHGTTYNGGNAPTVSGSGISSITTGRFIPYQLQDGSWRLRLNIFAVYSPALASGVVSINLGAGVTFDVSSAISLLGGTGYSNGAAANIQWSATSGTISNVIISGDVSLSGKPTWAY